MSVGFVVCMAIACILAALAAFYRPANPPPANLVALAIAFMALAFVVQQVLGGG